jgi:uncharacterized spore protein YtfJ
MLKKTITAELKIENALEEAPQITTAIDENTDKDKKKKSKESSNDKKVESNSTN